MKQCDNMGNNMKTYEVNTHDGGLWGSETYLVSAMTISTAIDRALNARKRKANKLKAGRGFSIYVTSAKEIDATVITK